MFTFGININKFKEKKMSVKESLAGSGVNYAVIQARIRKDDGTLHIQGKGEDVNRAYGVAIDVSQEALGKELCCHMESLIAPLSSLYSGSQAKYFELQAKVAKSINKIHFQIPSVCEHNREYGASFELPIDATTKPLADFIMQEVDICG